MAVGLSPRTESNHTIWRRVATAELLTWTGAFNRRSATRDNVVSSLLQGLAPRGAATGKSPEPADRNVCPTYSRFMESLDGFVTAHLGHEPRTSLRSRRQGAADVSSADTWVQPVQDVPAA